ncbi:Uncharacterised protein [uncultured archaeon]|nr:Uncharacterised protein [uncultured archaeon]
MPINGIKMVKQIMQSTSRIIESETSRNPKSGFHKKDAPRGLVGLCFQDVWMVNFMKTVQKVKEVKK